MTTSTDLSRLTAEHRLALAQAKRNDAPERAFAILEALGLDPGAYRLVQHLDLWLFCEPVTPSAKFYYGNDSIELSRLIEGAPGVVLDLCSGVGTQALTCARTAQHATAVEIEPAAAPLFWINAAMNGLTEKVELLQGDLLEPVAGRQFDLIVCNPPFMPVPPGIRYPRYADGGSDGLEVVRRLMSALPDALTPGGQCAVIGALLGTRESPDLPAFYRMAADFGLSITLDCRTCEELDGVTLKQLVGTAIGEFEREDTEQAFRSHFAKLNATHLYCYLLRAVPAATPMLCATYNEGRSSAVWR